MTKQIYEFMFMEYTSLQKQIDDITKEVLLIERWTVIATCGIWSWLLTSSGDNCGSLVYFIPSAITILFGLRALGLNDSNFEAGKYLSLIEDLLNLPEDIGWENKMFSNRPRILVITSYIFWVVFLIINVILPFFLINI